MDPFIIGTPEYLAPELIEKQDEGSNYGFKSDMWALGVIIFSLLCGRHPFDEPKRNILFQKIQYCDYEFLPNSIWDNISNECIELIENLLEPNPMKRFSPEQALK